MSAAPAAEAEGRDRLPAAPLIVLVDVATAIDSEVCTLQSVENGLISSPLKQFQLLSLSCFWETNADQGALSEVVVTAHGLTLTLYMYGGVAGVSGRPVLSDIEAFTARSLAH